MRYAHTVLFQCPDCNLPISTSRISENKNLEEIDQEVLSVNCDYCGTTSDLAVITAKRHYVEDWN